MESLNKPISQNIEIKCRRCGYEGSATVTTEYYINCPECDELVYVRHLIDNAK